MRYVLLIVVGAIAAAPVTAMDPDQMAIEKLLRAEKLVPVPRPNPLVEKRGFRVLGTSEEPRFETTKCEWGGRDPKPLAAGRFTYDVDNHGEFGGRLVVREGGGEPRELLRGDNFWHLVPFKSDLYVFGGLSHLGISRGTLYLVENYESHPAARALTNLPQHPDVVVPGFKGRGLFVISRLSITWVDHHGNLDVVMARRSPLYVPNSGLAMGWADLLVGMCGAVAWIHMPWLTNRPPDPDDEFPVVTYWARP